MTKTCPRGVWVKRNLVIRQFHRERVTATGLKGYKRRGCHTPLPPSLPPSHSLPSPPSLVCPPSLVYGGLRTYLRTAAHIPVCL